MSKSQLLQSAQHQ